MQFQRFQFSVTTRHILSVRAHSAYCIRIFRPVVGVFVWCLDTTTTTTIALMCIFRYASITNHCEMPSRYAVGKICVISAERHHRCTTTTVAVVYVPMCGNVLVDACTRFVRRVLSCVRSLGRLHFVRTILISCGPAALPSARNQVVMSVCVCVTNKWCDRRATHTYTHTPMHAELLIILLAQDASALRRCIGAPFGRRRARLE